VELYSHTHSRRFPSVLGKIQGWTIPWPIGPLTYPQVAVIVLTGIPLLLTESIWGRFGMGNWLVILGVPGVLAWVARAARIEGRSPFSWFLGILKLASAQVSAPRGLAHGKPFRPQQIKVRPTRFFVDHRPVGERGKR
jgi:hypothetical protein